MKMNRYYSKENTQLKRNKQKILASQSKNYKKEHTFNP